jgi:hypothetical protein
MKLRSQQKKPMSREDSRAAAHLAKATVYGGPTRYVRHSDRPKDQDGCCYASLCWIRYDGVVPRPLWIGAAIPLDRSRKANSNSAQFPDQDTPEVAALSATQFETASADDWTSG